MYTFEDPPFSTKEELNRQELCREDFINLPEDNDEDNLFYPTLTGTQGLRNFLKIDYNAT